jgi:hypothetical protein
MKPSDFDKAIRSAMDADPRSEPTPSVPTENGLGGIQELEGQDGNRAVE